METWHLPINCQIVAEYISEYLNFQNFPGGYVPGPYPTLGMDPFCRSLNKFLCHCISKSSSSVTYNENDTLIRDCVTIIRRGWGLKNEPHIEKYFKFSSDPPRHLPLARHPPNFLTSYGGDIFSLCSFLLMMEQPLLVNMDPPLLY